MLIYENITDRQIDKHIKSIVRNLTKFENISQVICISTDVPSFSFPFSKRASVAATEPTASTN